MKISAHYVFLLLLFSLFAVGQEKTKYTIVQRLSLTKKLDGLNGQIELLMDSRISERMRKDMWKVGPWDFVFRENSAEYRMFNAAAPLNAKVQIADAAGKVLWTHVFEYPLAQMTARPVFSQHIIFLAVDDSAGFGSYSGVRSNLFVVANRQLQVLEAIDSKTRKKEAIYLGDTLKTGWKMVPHGTGLDILSFYCRPAFKEHKSGVDTTGDDNIDFRLHYVRYRFDGHQWVKYERTTRGFWESEQPFPPQRSFPE